MAGDSGEAGMSKITRLPVRALLLFAFLAACVPLCPLAAGAVDWVPRPRTSPAIA